MTDKLRQLSLRVPMPRGFWIIFFIQVFSTLSFAVLSGALVLYLKQKLGFSSKQADIITGVYFAYNFALHLLAGYIAGRLFSYRSLILVGLIFQLIGCYFLALISPTDLYIGLGCMLIGTGTMVTCLNMLISQLFAVGDKRRETAFLWNYAGMNIGFFLGFGLAGYFQSTRNYHLMFLITATTNLIALGLLLWRWSALKDRQTKLVHLKITQQQARFWLGMLIVIALLPTLYWLLHHERVSDYLILTLGALLVCFIIYLAYTYNSAARHKLFVFIILLLSAQIFWMVYQLAPMGITLFALNNVDRHIWGITITPGWIQNINSVTIIVGAPLLAWLFSFLRKRKYKVTTPVQFMIGLLLTGIGLLVLPIGIIFANAQGYVAFIWIVINFVLLAFAELCISPISYSMVGVLVPSKWQSFFMGAVLLNVGVASILASFFSNYALGKTASSNPLVTNMSFSHAFSLLAWVALGFALLLFLLLPVLHKLMKK